MTIIATIGTGGLLSALLFQYFQFYFYHGLPFQKKSTSEKYFSNDYYEARMKFREAVHQFPAEMELHSLKLNVKEDGIDGEEDLDLTIDIGLQRRSDSKVMIHVSGTHGVEGFAGSAIQYSLLENAETLTHHDDKVKNDLPTLIFVHGLNAYGFAKLRRFNENNVDLNRNFLSQQQFDEMMSGNPNHSGYVDLLNLINPTESFETKWDFFYPRAIYAIARNGFNKLKQSLVTGNYHFPKTLFYGGEELQPSYLLLKEFLLTQLNIQNMREVAVIDVHTGLGPSGFDSILNKSEDRVGLEEVQKIFSGSEDQYLHHLSKFKSTHSLGTEADTSFIGYDKVVGFLNSGLNEQVFPPNAKIYSIAQEFGTVPGLLVFKALRAENAMHHYDPVNRSPKYAQDLCDVFYLKDNPGWKHMVVSRGQEVFNQMYLHLLNME